MANKFEETFTNIADAIREKTGTTEKIKPEDMASKISAISGGGMKTYFDLMPNKGGYFSYNTTLTSDELNKYLKYDDTENVTNMSYMFEQCLAIEYLPKLNTSKVTNMREVCNNCTKLTSIPDWDYTNVESLYQAFSGIGITKIDSFENTYVTTGDRLFGYCKSLTEVGTIRLPNITNAGNILQGCTNLQTVGTLEFDSAIYLDYLIGECPSLTYVHKIYAPNATSISGMFRKDSKLTKIDELTLGTITDMSFTFAYNNNLDTITYLLSLLDTSHVTTMEDMYFNCSELETLPTPDMSSVTILDNYCYGCTNLKTISFKNLTNLKQMSRAFYNCSSLVEVGEADVSSVTSYRYDFSSTFYGCTSLEKIHLKHIKVSMDISSSTKFTEEALVEILNNLDNPYSTSSRTFKMGSTNLAKLTDEEKAIATSKGWILA